MHTLRKAADGSPHGILQECKGLVHARCFAEGNVRCSQALRWENAPVLTDFDPRFNQKRLMFFERFYQPFLGKSQRIQEEPIYDK